MKLTALALCALAIAGCGERDQAVANSQATIWEAAEAIRIGRDPSGPIQVIQANAAASAAALGHPYPPPAPPTALTPEKP